jgi:hypothetical protein
MIYISKLKVDGRPLEPLFPPQVVLSLSIFDKIVHKFGGNILFAGSFIKYKEADRPYLKLSPLPRFRDLLEIPEDGAGGVDFHARFAHLQEDGRIVFNHLFGRTLLD